MAIDIPVRRDRTARDGAWPYITWRRVLLIVVVGALAWSAAAGRPFVRGLSLVVRSANLQGAARYLADLDTVASTEGTVFVPLPLAPIRARLYTPAHGGRQTVLLLPGVQVAGIDDPRLMALAHELAGSGVTVLTPDIPELSRFEITPALTDEIEQTALWLAASSGLAPSGRIGMIGASFSGSLMIVAAGRPSLGNHVSYVFAIGGHDDLPRVIRYLATGIQPPPPGAVGPPVSRTAVRAPHDYGLAVILLGIADRLVPADQVAPLVEGVRRYLAASYRERLDKEAAAHEFAALREIARTLPEPSATLLTYINSRDVVHLGARLLPYISSYGEEPSLSPSRSPKPSVPIYLLHGIDDNVVPTVESEYLAAGLKGHAAVRLLLTNLISHAGIDRPARVSEVIALASFLGDLLNR